MAQHRFEPGNILLSAGQDQPPCLRATIEIFSNLGHFLEVMPCNAALATLEAEGAIERKGALVVCDIEALTGLGGID